MKWSALARRLQRLQPDVHGLSTTAELSVQIVRHHCGGVLELRPRRFGDARGWFSEAYNRRMLSELGIAAEFVQDNQSVSTSPGTVRGLHLQVEPYAQGKLVRVLRGRIFDVAVDLRRDSPTYRRYAAVELSASEGNQLWIPAGFAHGFSTLEPDTEVLYKVTAYYTPAAERSILWNDAELNIAWPVDASVASLSDKDRLALSLAQFEGRA
jgi:dTDP-4-dehydrorhamnose 3,5-epimerase